MSYYRRKKLRRKKFKRDCFLLFLFLIICSIIIIYRYKVMVGSTEFYSKSIEHIINQDLSLAQESEEATTYYVSQDGKSLDGTDIANPMSLETANSKTYKDNDRILFKCGDIFYGQIDFKVDVKNDDGMIYIGNYGEGELPIITGATILNNKGYWELLENNIYRLDLSKLENFKGYTNNKSNLLYNVGFLEAESGEIYANRKKEIEELQQKFDFCCKNEYLYVYSEVNPDDILGNFKYVSRLNLINLYNNTIVTGLNIQYTGAHGISGRGENNNIYIHDCIIQKIGGSVLNQDTFSRYGNGVQFWNKSSNTIVERCIIRDIYDTGYTFQGTSVVEGTGFYNNICRDNIFVNCSYTFEVSCRDKNYQTNGNIKNCSVSGNISVNQGNNWKIEDRENKIYVAEIVFWLIPEESEIYMEENKYFNSTRMIYSYKKDTLENDKIKMDNNDIYYNKNTLFCNDELDKNVLLEYDKEKNSNFRLLSDTEINQISNQEILNSNNY